MSKTRILFLTCLIPLCLGRAFGQMELSASLNGSQSPAIAITEKVVPGEVLVRFRRGVTADQAGRLHSVLHATVTSESTLVQGLHHVRLEAGTNLRQALRQYRQDPRVLYAEPNYVVHATTTPNDPLLPSQWNMQNSGQLAGTVGADVHATQAWNISTGSSSVAVAVIDTGADYTHPDLSANIWTAAQAYSVPLPNGTSVNCPAGSRGFNMVAWTCDPLDDNGHGTHVSGIIGALGNNSVGVVGINWHVQIIPCKFLDATGSGDISNAIACLEWIHNLHLAGVPVIATNNSWGGGFTSQALADAIAAQASDGTLFVASAGNNFLDNDIETVTPATIFSSNLISVAATTNQDTLAAFSDIGEHSVFLGAPGQEILSTFPGSSYASLSGTSMAAPHVTGLAALLKAAHPNLDWRSIRNLIVAGGDPIASLTSTVSGRRMNAYGSLTCSGATVQKRLQPTMDVIPATQGQAVNLAALNIKCGNPAGSVQVTVQPGGQTITLSDNGVTPDQTAADGIYTGQFTPTSINSYKLTFPWGETVQVEVLNNYVVGETAYNYRTIAGTNLNLSDDAAGTISTPFLVHFGGATFNTIYVSSNGTASFTNKFDDFIPERIPADFFEMLNSQNGPPPPLYQPVVTLIAPWWQDLTPIPNSAHNVFWDITGAAPNRELVIEWRDLPAFECATDLSSTIKFQLVLSESSDNIISNYADTQFGGNCSSGDFGGEAEIGLQVSQTSGVEWGIGDTTVFPGSQSLVDGMALLWSVPAANTQPNPAPTVTSLSPSTITAGSGDTWVTVAGANFIPGTWVEFYPGYRRPTEYVSNTEVKFLLFASDLVAPQWRVYVSVVNPPPGGGYANTVYYTVTEAAPQITSISPTTAPAGAFGFVMTVNGSGFIQAGNLVFDTGTAVYPLQPSSTTATEMKVIIPDLAIRNAGIANVSVQGVNGNSNTVQFTITGAAGGIVAPPPNRSIKQSSAPPAPPFPARFTGWNRAAARGASFMKRFLRPRADLAPDVKPVPTEGVRQASAPPASLSMPGLGFRPRLPADFLPTAVVTGDFNGDGHIDWAAANGGSNNIWIYLGRGDGTSQVPKIVTLRGVAPVALAAADMNGDGKLDLVVAEADSLGVAVLLGNGDGTFQPERLTYVPGIPLCLTVADFDGDGHMDVVVGVGLGVEGTPIAMLRGDGKGNLGLPTFPFGGGFFAETVQVVAADLNKDGRPDIVAVQFELSVDGLNLFEQRGAGAEVYLNAGDGTFKLLQLADMDYAVEQIGFFGHAVTAVALGDVNRDGCTDLIAIDQVGLADYVPGLCNGTFDVSSTQTIGSGVPGAAAVLADVNGDGKLDLIVSGFHFNDNDLAGSSSGDALSIAFGNGDGTFSDPTIYRGEPSMYSIATGDLSGTGRVDIITANQDTDSVSVYRNDGAGAFGGPQGSYIGYLTNGIVHGTINTPKTNFAFADVDGDGYKDLIFFEWPLLSYQATNVAVMRGDGSGHFAPPVRSDVLYTEDYIQDFVVGDFRNTGHPEILVLDYNGTSTASWAFAELQNTGNGTFRQAIYPVNNAGNLWPSSMVAGDFNKDGNLDVVVLSYASGGVSLAPFFGHGNGTFTEGTPVPFSGSPQVVGLVAGDFNQDGKLDLLFLENGALYLLAGHGDGTFAPQQLLFSSFGPFAAVDLNGDGILDLVEIVADPGNFTPVPLEYKIYLGQSGGTFLAAGTYGPYAGLFTHDYLGGSVTDPTQLQTPFIADFNGDGNLDIAAYQTSITGQFVGQYEFATGPGTTALTFLLGNGDGTFTPTYLGYGMERYFVPQLAVDVNGDGRADLIQLDAINSDYHIISGNAGAAFQIGLISDPVVGSHGVARITLAFASVSGTTVQLTASDTNISLPSSVSIPAGSFRVDVPFQIGSGFNAAQVFQIQAQIGSEIHSAYGTKAPSAQSVGFAGALSSQNFVILASQTSPNYGLLIGSIGGYSTEVTLSCQGLAAGLSCNFGNNPLDLSPGSTAIDVITVNTPANLALGTYPFTVTLSDGVYTQQLQASLTIGDFSVSAPAQNLLSTGSSQLLSITVSSINTYNQPITIACNTGLPAGLTCPWEGAQLYPIGNTPAYVQTQGLTPGTYQWTITGTVGSISHSSTVPLYVLGQQPSVIGTISPGQATVNVGGSANFTVSLQSQNQAQGAFSLSCLGLPAGISCGFTPAQINLAANGSGTSVLTVGVISRPVKRSTQPVKGSNEKHRRAIIPLAVTLAAGTLLFGTMLPRRRNVVRQTLKALMVCVAIVICTVSCGGGSGSAPPPPPPTYVTFPVQASGPGVTAVVGNVTIAIPQ